MIRIKQDVAEFIMHAARNVYPDEFAALIRMKDGTIYEIIVVPKTMFGRGFSSLDFFYLPIGVKYNGSVHSHPSSNNHPSRADMNFFSRFGSVHIIIAYPFTEEMIAVYDRDAKPLDFVIVP